MRSCYDLLSFCNRFLLLKMSCYDLDRVLSCAYCHPCAIHLPYLCIAIDDIPLTRLCFGDFWLSNRSRWNGLVVGKSFIGDCAVFALGPAAETPALALLGLHRLFNQVYTIELVVIPLTRDADEQSTLIKIEAHKLCCIAFVKRIDACHF